MGDTAHIDLGKARRVFDTGASRDVDEHKLDPEGFMSVPALHRFWEYMHAHRVLVGQRELRESDNWQRGIPKSVYIKSLWRHFFDVWAEMRGFRSREGIENALCGMLFNTFGLLHVLLVERGFMERSEVDYREEKTPV